MKVLVMYNDLSKEPLREAADYIIEAAGGFKHAGEYVAQALSSLGYDVAQAKVWDAEDVERALKRHDPQNTVIFNMCESLEGKAFMEPRAVEIMEEMGFTYTGSGAGAMRSCLNKATAKQIFQGHNLPTAGFQVFLNGESRLAFRFPAIVKPVAEDASAGIHRNSVVRNKRQLQERVMDIVRNYHQPALVEEFLSGREFNVGVWGNGKPEALPIGEVDYSGIRNSLERLVTYEAKWLEHSEDYLNTPSVYPAPLEESLKKRVEKLAVSAYELMGLRDYGRIDIRMRGEDLFILEANPNPDLSPDAGVARAAEAAGSSYAQMLAHVLDLAVERSGKFERQKAPVVPVATKRGSKVTGPILPTIEGDKEGILALAMEDGFFTVPEVASIAELLDIYLQRATQEDYHFLSYRDGERVLGFACYGPASLTQGGFDLYWIAVHPEHRRRGIGRALLKRVEAEVRKKKGRMLLIETSSSERYGPTREFYAKQGYKVAATIPDYYAPGDGMVIYRKGFRTRTSS
ncbi:MAG: GNAT family N-acetyltransferase [Chloroflexi bacterium]|nr:GNAT family N-acetyltransferase [Chloroflexota bacterium]